MEKSPQPPLLFRCWATKHTSTSDMGCRLGEFWRREMRNLRYPPQLNKSFRGDVEFPGGCDFRHFNTHIWPARFCNVKKPRILDLSGLESAPGFFVLGLALLFLESNDSAPRNLRANTSKRHAQDHKTRRTLPPGPPWGEFFMWS